VSAIADYLNTPRATISAWKQRDGWDKTSVLTRVETGLEQRLMQLVNKAPKTGSDYKEIDLIGRQIERLARVRRYQQPGGHEGDLNPKINNRNQGRNKAKNEITDAQKQQLQTVFQQNLFEYQRQWYSAGQNQRIRNILKSRQIGATWYFAREALLDAVETGRNQIFLSASKAQAHVFKQYILSFAQNAAGLELKGDPIVLANGASLYFLGTNSRTAQSYHGNLYFDEYFWVHQFQTLRKVASGMAIHKHWRQTYFSTPSAITHEAYPFWSGELFNKGRQKSERIECEISHAALKAGKLGKDGQWRQIVTVEDAINGGCTLFDLAQLKNEYSALEWDNLLMCGFIDDTLSVFSLQDLQRCLVDSWEVWKDYQPLSPHPLGNRAVWIGYDPALSGDSAGLIVMAPPFISGGPFRLLEKQQFRGLDFAAQAKAIKQLTHKYNVEQIAIDSTGMGQGVYQYVRDFFPAVRAIHYSAESKSRMVLKAYEVIHNGRLQFDRSWSDLVTALLAIRRTLTGSSQQATFTAGRREDTGHADLAWALLHALDNEPFTGQTHTNSGFMEIY